MCKHAAKGNGLHDLREIMLESMMVAERGEFLADNPGNKGNGYRPGSTYGQGRKLEFRIPRDRYGNFHPQILAILRDQEEECDRLAGVLYTKGLTQEQVSDFSATMVSGEYANSVAAGLSSKRRGYSICTGDGVTISPKPMSIERFSFME